MRQLFIALFALLLPTMLSAQEAEVRVPYDEDIIDKTMLSSSPYYYTNLMLKYREGQEPLSANEYYYLYYGYAYSEDYRPFVENKPLTEILDILSRVNPEQPTVGQMEAIIERGAEALEIDPFNPKVLNIMA